MIKYKGGGGKGWLGCEEKVGGGGATDITLTLRQWKEQTWQQRRLQQMPQQEKQQKSRAIKKQKKKIQKATTITWGGRGGGDVVFSVPRWRRVNAAQNIIQKTLTHFSYAAHTQSRPYTAHTHTMADTDRFAQGRFRPQFAAAFASASVAFAADVSVAITAWGGGQLNVDLYNCVFLYIKCIVSSVLYTKK